MENSVNSIPCPKRPSERAESETDESVTNQGAFSLFIAFILYIIVGSFIIASYEPEMDVFKVSPLPPKQLNMLPAFVSSRLCGHARSNKYSKISGHIF